MANGFGFDVTKKTPAVLQPVQVQPAQVKFPTPRPPTRKTEKDPDKQLVQYGAGLLAPVLGELLTRGLGAIPGIDKFIYEDPAETRQEFGLPSLIEPSADLTEEQLKAKRLLAENPELRQVANIFETPEEQRKGLQARGIADPRQAELRRRRALVRQAFGDPGDMPRRKTFLGEIASQIGGVLPGLALDDDGDISTFVGASQAANKIASGIEAAKLDNYLKLERKRAESLLAVGDLKDYIGYSNFMRPGDSVNRQITRQIKASADGTQQYILSRGDKDIDAVVGPDGSRYAVPKGQYYVDPNFLFTDEKAAKPETHQFLVNKDDFMQSSAGFTQFELKDGRYVPVMYIRDQSKNGEFRSADDWAKSGVIWIKPPSNFYQLQENRPRANPEMVKMWKARSDGEAAMNASFQPLGTLGRIALRADGINPNTGEPLIDGPEIDLLTGLGGLKTQIALFSNEVRDATRTVSNVLRDTSGTSQRAIFTNYYDQAKEKSNQNNYFLDFFDAQNNFVNLIQTGAGQQDIDKARQKYYDTMRAYRDNVAEQGGSNVGFLDNLLEFEDETYEDFLELGADRALMTAAQTQLAYTIAAQDGNTGTALSDRDVSNYLMRAGFGSRNAKELLGKVETLFGDLVRKIDSPTILSQLSGATFLPDNEEFKTSSDSHLRFYGISQGDLDFIRDMDQPEAERRAIAMGLIDKINNRTQGQGGVHFDYNTKTGRLELRTVDKIMKRSMLDSYNFFNNIFLPTRGTSIEQIIRRGVEAQAIGRGQPVRPKTSTPNRISPPGST